MSTRPVSVNPAMPEDLVATATTTDNAGLDDLVASAERAQVEWAADRTQEVAGSSPASSTRREPPYHQCLSPVETGLPCRFVVTTARSIAR